MFNYIQISKNHLGSSGLDIGDSVGSFFPESLKTLPQHVDIAGVTSLNIE